jgi:hypothetical protein
VRGSLREHGLRRVPSPHPLPARGARERTAARAARRRCSFSLSPFLRGEGGVRGFLREHGARRVANAGTHSHGPNFFSTCGGPGILNNICPRSWVRAFALLSQGRHGGSRCFRRCFCSARDATRTDRGRTIRRGVQNWPGCAGGAGQSERRLLGLFRSKRSCLKTSPGLIMSGGGGLFRAP